MKSIVPCFSRGRRRLLRVPPVTFLAVAFVFLVPNPVVAVSTIYYWSVSDSAVGYGLTNTPPAFSNAVAVAANYGHVVGLSADGKVFSWGRNRVGETSVPAGLSEVVAVSTAEDYSVALTRDRHLVVWGQTNQLGHDPPPIALDNFTAVSCGSSTTVALRADGTVVAWGRSTLLLTNFMNGVSNIVGIGTAADAALAIRSDGTVAEWLGGWENIPSYVTNVVAVAGGFAHRLALRADGTVVGWGGNTGGALNIPNSATNVVAIAAQYYLSAAIRADGTVLAWGTFQNGTPFTNPPPLPFVLSVAVNDNCAVALANPTAAAAPFITGQPRSQSALYGTSITLSVFATGWGPFHYQWYFNGSNALAGATNQVLNLGNLQFSQSGDYRVRVSNIGGVTWSQPASINVIPGMHVDMVPRVRLEGQVGLTYRLDYVNVLGDPNGWMTITNVTLNSNPYYYLDQSAVGQPQRFYRATPLP